MKESNKHIDDIAKSKLQNLEINPPVNAWQNIEISLNKSERSSRIAMYYIVSGAAAIILLLLWSAIVYFKPANNFDTNNIQFARQNKTLDPHLFTITKKQYSIFSDYRIPSSNLIPFNFALWENTQVDENKNQESISFIKNLNSKNIILSDVALSINSRNNLVKKTEDFDWEDYRISEEVIKKDNKNKWNLGLTYSPNIKTSIPKVTQQNTPNPLTFDPSSGMESASSYDIGSNYIDNPSTSDIISTYSFGLNFSYAISDKLNFISGLNYTQYQNQIDDIVFWSKNYRAERNIMLNTNVGSIKIHNTNQVVVLRDNNENEAMLGGNYHGYTFEDAVIQRFEFIEIPLLINYTVLDSKIKIGLITGFNTDILVTNRTFVKNNESINIGSTEDVSEVLFKSVLGLSFNYPILKNLNFSVSPSYKYQLNRFNTNHYGAERLNLFNIATAIIYQF